LSVAAAITDAETGRTGVVAVDRTVGGAPGDWARPVAPQRHQHAAVTAILALVGELAMSARA
jgi:hypothetical protein